MAKSVESDPCFVVDRLGLTTDCADMRAHEKFVFKLGLELVYSSLRRDADSTDDKYDRQLKTLNAPFDFRLRKCKYCDFQSESRTVVDAHRSEPHFHKCTFECLSCGRFKSNKREDYNRHMLESHNRLCKYEKPFESYDVMCSICDFELMVKKNVSATMAEHATKKCAFRDENLNRQSNPNERSNFHVDYRRILDNLQSPGDLDFLHYEYAFNAKPSDVYVNKLNLFSDRSINNHVTSNIFQNRLGEEMNHYKQIHLYSALIKEEQNSHPSDIDQPPKKKKKKHKKNKRKEIDP